MKTILGNMICSFRGTTPSIDVSAYIDPSVAVIGDVNVGGRTSIWPNVTIRGDVDHIAIGSETSNRDRTVRLGKGAVVAAGLLALGVPATPKRPVTLEELASFAKGAKSDINTAAIDRGESR